MKNSLNTIAVLVLLIFAPLTQQAQTITCSSLCVTLIANDTITNSVGVTISISDSGFINYPYVHQILDQSNNVIGTGNMNFFGQFGNSSQTYPATSANTNWNNFVGTVVFVFDNDTCYLPYPCVQTPTINCSSFCASGIAIDTTVSGVSWVSITMSDTGFINYPYVLQILDANNNPVATGNMNFFGQGGPGTQDYNVNSSITNWNGFTGTIVFVFDNDTCYLPYPCGPASIAEPNSQSGFTLSPNPATDLITINTQNDLNAATIEILTVDGRSIQLINAVRGNRIEIPTDQLPNGVYFLRVADAEKFLKSERFVISR